VDAPQLSAVILCYRAEEGLRQVVEPLLAELRSSGASFELVLVANYDAGSDDRTPQLAEEFAASQPEVRALTHVKEGAMGWDMRSGLRAARGEHLIVIDGDGQVSSEDVLRAYRRQLETGADLVKGRRVKRLDGRYRRFLSAGYNLLLRLLFPRTRIWDVNGMPKALTRAAYERLELRSDDWFADSEIVLKAQRLKMRIDEFPVTFGKLESRQSFVGPETILQFLRNLIAFRLRGDR
jgi:glycosyltransferase involved in cell wall biosynthesis